ncbi:MAG: hypothetical protein ACJ8AJ_00585 [Gemmatimonadaceae bacterium]
MAASVINRPAAIGALIGLLGSLAAAVEFLATNNWFGAGDLSALVTWSLPLAAITYFSISAAARRVATRPVALQYTVLVVVGAVVGLAWTVIAALVLGGWIFAFSFPVLFCWLGGGLLSGISAALVLNRRSWPVAGILTIVVAGAVVRVNAYAQEPEPHVRVVLARGTTDADQERFWHEVIGYPGRRPGEFALLDGISGAGISDYEAGRPVFTVTFRKGIGRERRDSLIARIARSTIVSRVERLDSSPNRVRVTPSH